MIALNPRRDPPRRRRPFGRFAQRVSGFFAPRGHVTDDQALTARLLNGVLLASFPILLSAVAARLALGAGLTETANLALIALTAVNILAALILRSGRVYGAGFMMTFALWAVGIFLSWMYFGIRDPAAFIPLLAVLIAILALAWKTGIVLAVLSIGSIWLLAALELQGIRRPEAPNAVDVGLTLTAIFILVSLVALV